jgi:hypothetical protein
MFIKKQIELSLHAFEAMRSHLIPHSDRRKAWLIGRRVELIDGGGLGTVVESWVKVPHGFVALSKTSGIDAPIGAGDRWFRSSEGYLEVWQDVTSAEVAVHRVPFNQIVSIHGPRITVRQAWRPEPPVSSLDSTVEEQSSASDGKVGGWAPPLPQRQEYGTQHAE